MPGRNELSVSAARNGLGGDDCQHRLAQRRSGQRRLGPRSLRPGAALPRLQCVSVTETAAEKLVALICRSAMELAGLSRDPDPTVRYGDMYFTARLSSEHLGSHRRRGSQSR